MLARVKIGTAVGLGFTLAIVCSLVIAGASWRGLTDVDRGVVTLSDDVVPAELALAKVDRALADSMRSVNALYMPRLSGEVWQFAWKRLGECVVSLHDGRKEFEATHVSEETRAAWKAATDRVDRWEADLDALLTLLKHRDALIVGGRRYDSPEVQAAERQSWSQYEITRDSMKALDAAFVPLRAAMKKQAQSEVAVARSAGRRSVNLLLIALGVSTLALLLLTFAIPRHVRRVVAAVVAQSKRMSAAIEAGTLGVRADPSSVHQDFREVVDGINETMDAFVKPIELTAEYVERIAKGDLPPRITDPYEGDFNRIKENLNQCIEAVQALVTEAVALSKAAVDGRLATRADPSEHQGDYRRIVQGVNDTLDAVLGPIDEASAILEKLAKRDLTARVQGTYSGDHAKIKEAVNETAQALHDAMGQVARAVEQVSSASGQIASASQAVAGGASEQAASLEETSSSLESITSTTKQAADNAQQANGLAQQAKAAATDGSAAVEQMTGAMGKIKAAAAGTSQIIKDINEIAFQTNLLALNAAVEAARAGEAGRGFAVVAEEVRSLALRSKQAATRTEELIHQSVTEAGEGEVTAKHVQEKLAEIAGSISKVSDIVAKMAAAAKEQSVGIEQVSKAMEQMNQVTQQNAASSEESSSAATELSGQAQELAAMVATFRCDTVTPGAKPPVRASIARPGRAVLEADHGKTNGRGKKIGMNGVHARPPEQMIPLEADESLDVMKEF